jgi:Xaa-Pro aminopeptidase
MPSQLIADPGPLADVDRARALLREAGLDAVIASSGDAIFHLSAHVAYDSGQPGGTSGFAVLPADAQKRSALVLPSGSLLQLIDFPTAADETYVYGTFNVVGAPDAGPVTGSSIEALLRALGDRGLTAGRLGLELDQLTVSARAALVAALPDAELIEAGPLLAALRSRKTSREIERQRHATRAVERAITTALSEAEPGLTELDVDRRIRALLADARVEPNSIFVGASERGAYVLSWASERTLVAGDLIRVDVTATYGGYHADLSRNVAVASAGEEQRKVYRASRLALEAAIDAVGPGVPVRDVFDAAYRVAHAEGLHDYERHHVGHGIGLQVHETPDIDRSDTVIESPSVLSIETPYYRHGFAGVSPEDALLVKDDGVQRWTTAPFDLPVVGR